MRSRPIATIVATTDAPRAGAVCRHRLASAPMSVTLPDGSGDPSGTSEARCYPAGMGLGPLSPTYSSGHDISVEADGARFAFSAEDFSSRTGSAAIQLRLIRREQLGAHERADLVAMALHGRIAAPASGLAGHIEAHRERLLSGDADLVHWLRRLVFRGAWIDQQVTDGALVPEFDEARGFRYRGAATGMLAADALTIPDWSEIEYGNPAA